MKSRKDEAQKLPTTLIIIAEEKIRLTWLLAQTGCEAVYYIIWNDQI